MADHSYDQDQPFQGNLISNESGQNARISHPFLLLFHITIRCACVLVYLLCGWFSDSFVSSFLSVVVLLSIDFWTVKNVSGRVLVGLRWWNYVDDNGRSKWVFESRPEHEKDMINSQEATLFWLTLYLFPALWALFFIVAVFSLRFKWMVLVIIAIILNLSNLYGYIRCKIGKKQKLSTAASNFFHTQILTNMVSKFTKKEQPVPQRGATNMNI